MTHLYRPYVLYKIYTLESSRIKVRICVEDTQSCSKELCV